MAKVKKKLGQILVQMGVINDDQLMTALGMQKGAGKRIGEVLIDAGMAKEEQVAQALAKQFQLEYIDPGADGFADTIDTSLVPEDLQRKHLLIPIEKRGNRIKVVVHDPKNLQLFDELRFRLNADFDLAVGARGKIKMFLDGQGGGGTGGGMMAPQESIISASIDKSLDKSVDRSVDTSIDQAAESAPIIKLCSRIIVEAVKMGTSDIHIEPMGDRVRLRYRIDGVCMERDNLPKRMQNAVLTRFKLMASMNISEKRIPQDGRIKMPVTNDDGETQVIDFRVSACPAYHGESIVLRILRPDSVRIGLENLGFEADHLEIFHKVIRRPNGIFLVTGPTGSGKTTTLYSALDILNRPDKKIITAEDPIEYAFSGINQCQVRESIGLTFSSVLRAMLRQAPNIILVGEIRDKEVAEVAIQAALTGHLVFSTLHTNDAPSAITRLIDMGVKPFLVASSIQAVMAQRLIRKLCDHCREPDEKPDPKYLRLVGITPEDRERNTIYKPVGCERCNGTGYKGRRAIFEFMTMNATIRDLAFKQSSVAEIRAAARANGMRTLVSDGRMKILRGVTAPSEIARMAQTEGVYIEDEDEALVSA
ncbi:MAG: ATPase, T2SS/T4P/T4SS family [Planctomycetota bacterium]